MSPLRAQFVSFLELRGFTKATVRNYVQAVKQFQDWLGKSPVHMTRDSAHRYLDYLKNVKKLAPRTMNIHIYALKRFCDFFLPDSGIMEPFTRMHTPRYQPTVISATAVSAMIDASPNLKAKALITTLYSSGIRQSECLNLRIGDIDSTRMVLRIFGKGQRERYALLSPTALEVLRAYYRQYRPKDLLFPGYKPNAPLSSTAAARIVRTTAAAAGIKSRVTAHVLRHSFATHLLERGESLLVIQKLLGHANVSTTAIYTQVSARMLQDVKSPLDQPPVEPAELTAMPTEQSQPPRRGPGRPKGSKNKPAKRGRPKGSRNKATGSSFRAKRNRKGGRS
jgi:site-specific recombinase XerD